MTVITPYSYLPIQKKNILNSLSSSPAIQLLLYKLRNLDIQIYQDIFMRVLTSILYN